jgi:hypothetical protein
MRRHPEMPTPSVIDRGSVEDAPLVAALVTSPATQVAQLKPLGVD